MGMNQNSIKSSVWSVLWRIAIFITYYLLLIAIGLLIIAAVILFVINYAFPIISSLKGTLFWLAIIAFIGLCCLAVMFAVFLIKPLVSFTESTESDNTVEVEREDCPKLFDVISEIVKQTGTKMPKHVYLSPDVNACVFFDSSIWSIILPIRKNLKIGLGLLNGMSIDELKSILAHEFGHFSQKSMKIGSSVYVVNQILYNMTTERDNWDDLLESWCSPDSDNIFSNTFAFFGIMTRGLTSWVKKANVKMYGFVQKSYMRLSRQMEYDADNIACACVGREAFISAMYKTEVNVRNNNDFIEILKVLFEDKKTVGNVFDAIEITNQALHQNDPSFIKYDVPLTQPLMAESRIRVNDSRSSHPLLSDRIENAKKNESKGITKPIAAWELIPKEIAEQVSVPFFWAFDGNGKRHEISNEEFTSWVNEYVKSHYMPYRYRAFFARNILPFELEPSIEEIVDDPFTNKNRHIIDEYFVTLNDWNLLQRISNKEVETKSLYIDGQAISDKSLPLNEYDNYLSLLYPRIGEIDHHVFNYLQKNCNEEDRGRLENAYRLLFYAENALSTTLPNLINGGAQARANLKAMIDAYQGFNMEAAMQIVQQFVAYFRQCMNELNYGAIEHVAGKEYISLIENSLTMSPDENNVSEVDYINKITGDYPNELYELHQSLLGLARRTLCEISDEIGEEKTIENLSCDESEEKLSQRIAPITIDNTAGGVSASQIIGILAILLVIIGVLCYLLFSKHDTANVVENPEKTEILKTPFENDGYSRPNSKNDIMSIMSKGNGEPLSAKKNETTDGRIAFVVPKGVSIEKVFPVEGDSAYFGFDIFDNEQQPNYSIRILSKYMTGAFGYNEFEDILKKYDKERSLEKIVRTRADNSRYLDNNTFCYEANRVYETDPKMATDIAVIRSYSRHVLCYIICERTEDVKSAFDDIVKTIRFE